MSEAEAFSGQVTTEPRDIYAAYTDSFRIPDCEILFKGLPYKIKCILVKCL